MRDDGVSFIIPNWNHELALPRAIESSLQAADALRAAGLGAETVVVDDGSRDGSMTLLRQIEALYPHRNLKVVAHRENRGPIQARLSGLGRASYRYALWLDADNAIVPENVPLFHRAIRQTGAAAVYGTLLLHDPEGAGLSSHESVRAAVFRDNYIGACSLCDVEQWRDADAVWHDPRCENEDWERWLHLAANGRSIVHVPVVMGHCHSPVNDAVSDGSLNRIHRAYSQTPEARERAPLRTRHLRYHPDVGWL